MQCRIGLYTYLLPVQSLVNFCQWKWACKTRRWDPRPRPSAFGLRQDRDLTKFSRDQIETFQNSVWRLSRDRDFIPAPCKKLIKLHSGKHRHRYRTSNFLPKYRDFGHRNFCANRL